MRLTATILPTVWLVALSACVCAQGEMPPRKLVAVGWDMPTADRLRANLEAMEATPFQGCSVRLAGPGNTPAMWFSFSREAYDPQILTQITEDLKAVQPAQLQARFLLINANPGGIDWFDDAGWAVIVEHWRAAARVAREGGLRGIMFDPEAYKEPWRQFDWRAQPETAQHTFLQYREMARQRGRELMAAVAGEYPEATVLALFLLSINGAAAERSDTLGALSGQHYGLLPSFVDGWLDAAPATMTFVDGCERAYRFNSREEYLAAANLIRNKCQRLVSPENRAKYRAQVQVSFGVYLDAYVNPPDSNWYIDPGRQTPVRRLADNVASALEAADEYVWIYGEQASWWPSPHPTSDKVRWEEKLPGIDAALRMAADPGAFARRVIGEPGERKNAVVNGDFSATTIAGNDGPKATDWQQGKAPPNWSFWQTGVSQGHPDWDREVGHDGAGAGVLVGVSEGCLIHSVPVAPGERYVVGAWRRIQGGGSGSLTMRWQTAEGKWHAETLDRSFGAPNMGADWELVSGAGVVPEGAGRMVLLLSASGQSTEQDVIWWDDVVALRVE